MELKQALTWMGVSFRLTKRARWLTEMRPSFLSSLAARLSSKLLLPSAAPLVGCFMICKSRLDIRKSIP